MEGIEKIKMERVDKEMSRNIILIAFALSGMAALIYEVVWTRPLSLIFGSTEEVGRDVRGSLLFQFFRFFPRAIIRRIFVDTHAWNTEDLYVCRIFELICCGSHLCDRILKR